MVVIVVKKKEKLLFHCLICIKKKEKATFAFTIQSVVDYKKKVSEKLE